MKPAGLRPWVHAGMPAALGLLPWIGVEGIVWASGVAVLANALLLPRTPFGRALRREGEPPVGGLVTYPLAILLVFVLAEPWRAALAWIGLAVADPLAAAAGKRFGTTPLPWNRRKTLLGFFVLGWTAGGAMGAALLLLGPTMLFPSDSASAVRLAQFGGIAVAAAAAAIVESLPLPLDDNLPVALTLAGVLTICGV